MPAVIPLSVLIDICKAIEEEEEARDIASQTVVPLSPHLSRSFVDPIMHIKDVEVRRWALTEIKGVRYVGNDIGE